MRFPVLHIKEENWNVWIPLLFAWIPIVWWLMPRFRWLASKGDTDIGKMALFVFSWLSMTGASMSVQKYLDTATGKLREVSSVRALEKTEEARYYRLEKFYVVPSQRGAYTDFRVLGKQPRLNLDTYVVTPLVDDTSAGSGKTARVWYATSFREEVTNTLSDKEIEAEKGTFLDFCNREMDKYNFYTQDHFERLPHSEERNYYLKAIVSQTQQDTDNCIILKPVMEQYEDRSGQKLLWAFLFLGGGIAFLMLWLLGSNIDEAERLRQLEGNKSRLTELLESVQVIIPRPPYFSIKLLAGLHVLVFLLLLMLGNHPISMNHEELLAWGAHRRPEVVSGAWWRLLTSIFLQNGLLRLLIDVSALLIAGMFLEPFSGKKKFLIIYLVAGICGCVTSILWQADTVSAGATGAVSGIFGALFAWKVSGKYPELEWKILLIMIAVYLFFSFGTDYAMMIGGFLGGAAIARILESFKK